MLSPTENSRIQKIVEFKDFSRLLSDFSVLFKADLIFKDFSRKPTKFKYFSSLCEPWVFPVYKGLILSLSEEPKFNSDEIEDLVISCSIRFVQ